MSEKTVEKKTIATKSQMRAALAEGLASLVDDTSWISESSSKKGLKESGGEKFNMGHDTVFAAARELMGTPKVVEPEDLEDTLVKHIDFVKAMQIREVKLINVMASLAEAYDNADSRNERKSAAASFAKVAKKLEECRVNKKRALAFAVKKSAQIA